MTGCRWNGWPTGRTVKADPAPSVAATIAASPVPMLRDGELVEVQKMKITLTVDHRAMDGATGAAFLRDLKGILEQPLRILV